MTKVDLEALAAIFDGDPVSTEVAQEGKHRLRLEEELESAEERAAIMEFDGGLPRKAAEAYAFRNIITKSDSAL